MTVNRRGLLAVLSGGILGAACASIFAQNKTSQAGGRPSPAAPAKKPDGEPEYVPATKGKPGGRVSGGARGTPSSRDIFVLSVLAPDHVGLTVHEQPSLFWFISRQTGFPVEITLMEQNAERPLLQTRVASSVEHGVHRVRLADHNIRLTSGMTYQWSVAVIPDAERRSRDIFASGMIERVQPDSGLASQLSAASPQDQVFAYARAGIWYDALETVSDLIERSPADEKARRYRAALLAQIGLSDVNDAASTDDRINKR
jgi:hypothetical protein